MPAEPFYKLADAILDLDRIEDVVIVLRIFYVGAYMEGHGTAPIGATINQAKLGAAIKGAERLRSITHEEREREMSEAESHIAIIKSETACGALVQPDRVIGLEFAAEQVSAGNELCKICLKEVAMHFAKPAGLRVRKA